MSDVRPYRSHRLPACASCRQRRVRCAFKVQGQACARCRKNDLCCSTANASSATSELLGRGHIRKVSDRLALEGTSRIVGPIIAQDMRVMRQQLQNFDNQLDDDLDQGHQQHQSGQHRPIYHVSIPPPRPASVKHPRNLVKDLLDHMKPSLDKLIEIFLRALAHLLSTDRKEFPSLKNAPKIPATDFSCPTVNLHFLLLGHCARIPDGLQAGSFRSLPDCICPDYR